MLEETLQMTPLNWSTRPGLFLADGGFRFWVFESFWGRYAVQLDEYASYAQFTAHQLDTTAFATGAWLGPVTISLGPVSERIFRSRCGIIGSSGLRYFIRVMGADGDPLKLVILPHTFSEPRRYTSLFPKWVLNLSVGSTPVRVFQSADDPPKISCRKETAPMPRLVWSSVSPAPSDPTTS